MFSRDLQSSKTISTLNI